MTDNPKKGQINQSEDQDMPTGTMDQSDMSKGGKSQADRDMAEDMGNMPEEDTKEYEGGSS